MGIFKEKSTFAKFREKITNVIVGNPNLDEDFLDELEESLIISDIGIDTTEKIMEQLRERVNARYITKPEEVQKALESVIADLVDKGERNQLCKENPLIILMIGINGGGKTTSIGKIANLCQKSGRSVMLAAADTFRAAAAEQLQQWGERIGVRVIRHEEGTDPSAVIYDSIQAAKAAGTDVLICDTAGRLQNKKNLMKELEKMNRIIDREYPEAHRETLLVLDSTTGKNAVSQAQEFSEIAEITGLVLTKLDGTARGGIAITVTDQFDIPIKYIGVGEGIDDLLEFDPTQFAEEIFDE
ncbi:MAG: signal recognition particle-docking protein FtsY [Clostridia bacterium]|uniref:Signal recognition particle receptor FtsY n=1 Tax=Mogibacterium kristiansenii TaxID=2606708 RepID=A0A6N7X682_9FIRM|nr:MULTISPECIES: signal recognition particle-docking protein FtsY [Mogibacterium]MDY5450434.1 signal recognition particle-docking protein FtsY [Clostridia bacterium]MCI7123863.1 signal recognition particle-docking protein FtsY [Mogibacterium sp.]MDD6700655.1 signal recognition particle-docking protein FtsY [Mogibacterium kristiansenii]MEE0369302.1 signal recognition particle-docking protein FtsY [Clostridia bacterium]MST70083.1 signal recognition particle-docking protein FtsY [Mogibacterium kr